MVKVITIKDSVYEKLAKIKKNRKESFSDAIGYLIDLSLRIKGASTLKNLAGSISDKDISQDRLRRVVKW